MGRGAEARSADCQSTLLRPAARHPSSPRSTDVLARHIARHGAHTSPARRTWTPREWCMGPMPSIFSCITCASRRPRRKSRKTGHQERPSIRKDRRPCGRGWHLVSATDLRRGRSSSRGGRPAGRRTSGEEQKVTMVESMSTKRMDCACAGWRVLIFLSVSGFVRDAAAANSNS